MDKPTQIKKGGKTLTFTYGPQHMRCIQVNDNVTTYYSDKLYEEETDGSKTTWRAYIDDIAVISQTTNEGATIRYTHRDRLGSARIFSDHNGYVTAQRNFDPFGKPKLASGDLKAYGNSKLDDLDKAKTRRGFTDHEHLDDVELIHMNGRVYDYNLGRFMSVDPFVHTGSQGVNPYSYMMNNPMAGVDPTGYAPETDTFKVDEIENVEVYADGSVTVNLKNGSSESFANAKISDGKTTVDIGSQMQIAKRDAAISQYVYNSKSTFSKGSSVQRLNQKELDDKGLGGVVLNDEESGFISALYHDSERDEYIYAFAGTNDAKGDMVANLAQGNGDYSKQHDLAQANTGIIRQALGGAKANLSTTGHSLGGGLASLAAKKYSLRSSTFNSAGVHRNSIMGFFANNGSSSRIMAYYFERDIVSWGQDQTGLFPRALGNRIMINPAFSMQGDNQREMLRAHGINEIIKALEKY